MLIPNPRFRYETPAKGDTTGAGTPPAPTGGVDPKEFDRIKGELAAAQAKALEGEKRWENAQAVLIKGINPETEAQARQMFKDAGYNDVQIEQQLASLRADEGGGDDGDDESATREQPRGKRGKPAGDDEEGGDPDRTMMQQQIKHLQDQLNGQQANRLQEELSTELNRALEGDKDLSRMLKAVKEKDEEKYKEVRKQILQEVETLSKGKLSRLREVTGRLDTTKFSVYAKESVASVSGKFRSVIDAVAPLGRSSETDSGIAAFLESAPVKLSTRPTGKDAVEEVTAYMADALSRAVHGGGDAGSRA